MSSENFDLIWRNRNSKYFKFLYFASISWFVSIIVVCACRLRPVQDDYAILGLVSRLGIIGMLNDSWVNHGGNLFPMLLNALALIPSQMEFNFMGIAALSIVTLFLVFGAFLSILDVFFHKAFIELSFRQGFIICSTLTLCFESLFTPQLAEVLAFSSASLVHLWPVCLFFIGLRLTRSRGALISCSVFFLGLTAGNCNIAEAMFITFSLALLMIARTLKLKIVVCLASLEMSNLLYFLIGSTLGMFTIVLSPGFWNRASSQTNNGTPNDVSEFGLRFIKSLLIFSADMLSHPGIILCITLGFLVSSNSGFRHSLRVATPILFIFEFALFTSLVFGATFAYPAWHQSIALYILLPCLGIGLPSIFPQINLRNFNVLKILAPILITILILVNIRGLNLISNRGEQWDLNRDFNYCLATNSTNGKFLGAGIRYQPFDLGIEDLSEWEWMANSYRDWVQSEDFNPKVEC